MTRLAPFFPTGKQLPTTTMARSTSRKSPYRSRNVVHQPLPRPEVERRPHISPIPEREVYTRTCARCGEEFRELAQPRGVKDRHVCTKCQRGARAAGFAKWRAKMFKGKRPKGFAVRCLRCSWTAEVGPYPKGGWVCGRDPSHQVVAE